MTDAMDNLNGMYIGEITNIDDPENMGRVMVEIPAMGPVGWCRRLNGGAVHHKKYGITGPAIIGLQVAVFFEGGYADNPWYMYADGEVPTDGKYRMRFGSCEITIEEKNSGKGVISLTDTSMPDANKITLDTETNEVTIQAFRKVSIQAIGEVEIAAAIVKIQGRVVVPGGHPVK